MTEYSKYIEHSFVAYNENTYHLIHPIKFQELLEQALTNQCLPEELYTELKQHPKPNLHTINNLTSKYEKIAQKAIAKEKKIVFQEQWLVYKTGTKRSWL